jgi:hypothetical protein
MVKIYLILEASGWSDWGPGPIPGQGGSRVRQTGGEILPAHVYHNEDKAMVWITPEFSSFYVCGPSSSARSGRAISGTGCMVSQPFAAGGN